MKNIRKNNSHKFIGAWVKNPLAMGSLIPSSKALAKSMVNQINLEDDGYIIEVGAGTGSITDQLIKRVPKERLLIIELNKNLCTILERRFPDYKIVCGNVIDLKEILEENSISKVNAVVSGLPLLSMSKKIRHVIEDSMLSVLDRSSQLIQFTYSNFSPIASSKCIDKRILKKRVDFVIKNVPPAHVWIYKKDINDV